MAIAILENRGSANEILIDASADGNAKVRVNGTNNRLVVGPNATLHGTLTIQGHDCSLVIGEGCRLTGDFGCYARGAHLAIGAKTTTTMGTMISLHEAGRIAIGEDCMFSGQVLLDVSDMHSILRGEIPPGVVVAGAPARVVRTGVRWVRERI